MLTIIQNVVCPSLGDSNVSHWDVIVEANRIQAVLPAGASGGGDFQESMDASGKCLIPGLINAHTHSHANLVRGVADCWMLEASLTHGPWLSGRRDPEMIYYSTLWGALEMMSKGVTACYDLMYEFPVPTEEGIQAVSQAYSDAGMRAVIAPMIADRTFFDAIPGLKESLPEVLQSNMSSMRLASREETLAACRSIFEHWSYDRGLVTPAIAPTIPLHCSETFLHECHRMADTFGLLMHMHVAESRVQVQAGWDVYGMSLVAYLKEKNVLSPRFTAAHAVWLDEDDFKVLADAGAHAVHMPMSNMRLGCGVADMGMAMKAGVSLGLASDGANSADGLNLFEAMKWAALLSRTRGRPPEEWLGSREVFRMATEGGARVIGREDSLGKIEQGYCADFVLIEMDDFSFVPNHDVLNQLVYSENGSNVCDVMIDGRWTVRDRQPVNADKAEVGKRVQSCASQLHEQTVEIRKNAEELAPHVMRFALDYQKRFSKMRRYLEGG